jgi:endonuclease YncB( thermonuclease family)
MKKIIIIFLALLLFSCEENRPNLVLDDDDRTDFPEDSIMVTYVNYVYDGDTFNCTINHEKYDVRVLKIDCFETSVGDRLYDQADKADISVDSALSLGKMAKDFANEHIRGKYVTIIRDKYAPNTDVYHRLLRIVEIDGIRYDSLLIENNLVVK